MKYVSAKIAEKIRWSVHESETSFKPEWDFHSPWPDNPHSISHINTNWIFIAWSGLKLNRPSIDVCLSAHIVLRMLLAFSIDILGPRLPTHTWRGRHMYEDPRWRRQPGKKLGSCITKSRFLGFFDGLTASNPVPLDFFENRPLLRRFWM